MMHVRKARRAIPLSALALAVSAAAGTPVVPMIDLVTYNGLTALDAWSATTATVGDTLYVGLIHDDTLGTDVGIVRVYDISDPDNPVETGQLLPDESFQRMHFGNSIAVDGEHVLVGADQYALGGYLFDAGTGELVSRLTTDTFDDWDAFGRSVAIRGDRALIGGPVRQFGRPGYAVLYDISDPANPAEIARLNRTDGSTFGDGFGDAVVLLEDIAVVGAPGRVVDYDAGGVGDGQGRVRLYSSADGSLISEVSIPTGQLFADFGYRVAATETRLLVGAPADNTLGTLGGAAYLFDISDPTSPAFVRPILAEDPGQYDQFGQRVAMNDQVAIIGTVYNESAPGVSGIATYTPDLSVHTGYLAAPAVSPGDTRWNIGLSLEGADATAGWININRTPGQQDAITIHTAMYETPQSCSPADIAVPLGVLNFFDVAEYTRAYLAGEESADLAEPIGVYNFFDISAYLGTFHAGCH